MKLYIKIFLLSLALMFLFCSEEKKSGLHEEEIEYKSNGTVLKGFLAYDNEIDGKRPGILVVHEWWGHNDYARKRARMLAKLGYTAIAVDMYGDGKQANHPDDAGKFAGEVFKNIESAKNRFIAALTILQSHPTTEPTDLAAIGYCFGGGIVLHMARFGIEIDGVVSFHGSLATNYPAETEKVEASLLVCNGEEDNFVTEEQIQNFKDEMINAAVDFEFISYPNAKHSFTNPDADKYAEKFGLNIAYNKEADEQSWRDMQEFFKKIFQK